MEPRVTDVEGLKKKARKLAAGKVLAGGSADVRVDLDAVRGCRVCIQAGYGPLTSVPQPVATDRLIWILDGFVDVETPSGIVTRISQGESTVLLGGSAYRLLFPSLSLYLSVEAAEAT